MLVLGLLFGYQTPEVIAHGALIEATQTAVTIKATFDNGEPMAAAQVLIYSPSDPKTPWIEGQTDEKGYFLFSPEGASAGQWEATVRQAGHGGTTTFAVEGTEGLADSASGAGASRATSGAGTSGALPRPTSAPPLQRWISMAAIIWGFVGTALFFARKPLGGKA